MVHVNSLEKKKLGMVCKEVGGAGMLVGVLNLPTKCSSWKKPQVLKHTKLFEF